MTRDVDMDKCKCTFRQKLAGDGCEICNPKYMEDMMDMKEKAENVLNSHWLEANDEAREVAKAYLNQCEVNRVLVEALKKIEDMSSGVRFDLYGHSEFCAEMDSINATSGQALKQAEDV